ncbi:uncharacterized protein LOC120356961 isoform X2 [Solenopsis invicta]|uniref:uncharacterized protein LOC120356961 isoform X2 n=1 Tax=Solenopsis invicta TaxID=13686 RepID=UPI00193E6B1E|nr:uncharacterized protein LOC120356961 isoform X2 [Solenopsis invicta]
MYLKLIVPQLLHLVNFSILKHVKVLPTLASVHKQNKGIRILIISHLFVVIHRLFKIKNYFQKIYKLDVSTILMMSLYSKFNQRNQTMLQIRDNVQKIVRELHDLPKKITDQLGSTIRDEVRRAIKAALIQNAKVPCKPTCLPFKSPEDLMNFDRLSNEVYTDVIRYLSHVGGWTARSCANSILKESANDKVFIDFTFTGYKGKNIFKRLCFAKACEEAMAANPNFQLTQTVFKDAITEALRSSKQRFRNRQELQKC